MTPAVEKAQLASVQLALERLLDGVPKTRADLFEEKNANENTKNFHRRIIRALESLGVIYKSESGVPLVSKVHLKNRRKVEAMLASPVECSYVLWPSNRPLPPPPSQPTVPPLPLLPAPQEHTVFIIEDTPQEKNHEETKVEQAQAPIPAPAPTADPNQQLLERLLVVMDAACQRIIYMSEKLEALEPKINHLWEQLK